jgi:hypothetical protein
MEWVIACDQPFEEVERPEFIAMMNHTHHGGTSLKIPKCDGIKRRLMKMGDDTIEDVRKMFSVRSLFYLLNNSLIPEQNLKGKVSLSLDAWTSTNQYAFMAIVAHYVSNDGQLGASPPFDLSIIIILTPCRGAPYRFS